MPASSQGTDKSISNFKSIFKAASEQYSKLAEKGLETRPFSVKFRKSSASDAILEAFRKQAERFETFGMDC
jgi:hypothetical protein